MHSSAILLALLLVVGYSCAAGVYLEKHEIGTRTYCGPKLGAKLRSLCTGSCYGPAENLGTYACVFRYTDEALIKRCCPNGPSEPISPEKTAADDAE